MNKGLREFEVETLRAQRRRLSDDTTFESCGDGAPRCWDRPVKDELLPVVLGAAAAGGPVGKGFEAVAVFPGEMKELAGVEIGGFLT